jgi:acyl dehydratase
VPITELEDTSELLGMIGQEIGVTDWFTVDQARINRFADATEDRQWIHLDAEKAKQESPYSGTIAHGFLTLSLLSFLLSQAICFRRPAKLGINYGLNRVRFPSAVSTDAKIRGRFSLAAVEKIKDGAQITWNVTIECDQGDKPCCVAEWITRRYE